MSDKEIAKIALRVVATIDNTFDELAKRVDYKTAEGAYNAVAMTMLTRICAGMALNRGQHEFEEYWSDITDTMKELVKQIACKETRH